MLIRVVSALRLLGGVALFVAVLPLIFGGALLRWKSLLRTTMVVWCRVILRLLGVRQSLAGLEHIPPEGGFVLVANHESHVDGVLIVGYVPRYVHVMAKKELFDTFVVGPAFRAVDFIELDRRRGSKARVSIGAGAQRVRDGAAALIFPEGTRSPTGELAPFKKGAVIMALDARVPLVPVGLAGTREVFRPDGLIIRPGPCRMVVGPPIPVDGMTFDDRDALNKRVEEAVTALRAQARADLGLPLRAADSDAAVDGRADGTAGEALS